MSPVFKDLANAIRFLSIDAVQKANSGHPGLPMGMADVATVLFKYYLRFNPKNPSWINRDRFVLSAGHGSMLLYSLLYLTGYKSISIRDIQNFRQLNSICAGHPEYEKNSGIETTTGPLGQGLSNAVGMAIAEEIMKKKFGSSLINHKTYVIASDGDFMEGISHEVMSLAGHLKLKNLIVLFDNNKTSIDGSTKLTVSDNYKKRFESYGWSFQEINGHNEKQISKAIKKSLNSKKPNLISCKTIIGYGSPNKSGKASSHGAALGEKEVQLVRKKLNWKFEPFVIPEEILNEWRRIGEKGILQEKNWNAVYGKKSKKIKDEFSRIINNKLPKDFDKIIKELKKKFFDLKPNIASRQASANFLEEMTNNNFRVLKNSATNVTHTPLVMTYVFSMELDKVKEYLSNNSNYELGHWKTGDSKVQEIFKSAGYKLFISLENTVHGTPCGRVNLKRINIDKCISQKVKLAELEFNLLKLTPVFDILGKFFPNFLASFVYDIFQLI